MKKLLAIYIVLIIICIAPVSVHADIGPKPSVVVDFEGFEDLIYYVTLLSKEDSTGPYSVSDDEIELSPYRLKYDKGYGQEAWEAFRNYRDKDGFYFIEFFEGNNDENFFEWTYYPPSIFKILVYFPQTDTFLVSDIYERYAFDSYYTVAVDEFHGDKTMTAERSYDYSLETKSLLARIIGTIIIEIVIALFFGLKSKNVLLFIASTNIATQTILNILLNMFNYADGSWAFVFHYIWMEALVIAIEITVYNIYFKKKNITTKKWGATAYAIIANLASFAIGLLIANILPGIF